MNVVTLPSFGQVAKSGHGAANEGQEPQFKRKLLAPALKMLKAKGVPVDPGLLLGDDWRSQLEPALARMPAMSERVRVTEPMKGVYLAGLLLLPEHISLTGDTLILTRELAPDDENSTISITGDHQLFIFNIGDSRKFAAMFRKKSRSELLNIACEEEHRRPANIYIPDGYIGWVRIEYDVPEAPKLKRDFFGPWGYQKFPPSGLLQTSSER